jgi:hypothetical protein
LCQTLENYFQRKIQASSSPKELVLFYMVVRQKKRVLVLMNQKRTPPKKMIVPSLTKKQTRAHEAKVKKMMKQPDVFG